MSKILNCPTDEMEMSFSSSSIVCGMDEVGRGAWAGPLVMACVVPGVGTIEGVKDSKKLSEKNRIRLSQEIALWAKGIGVGVVSNREIDKIGLAQSLNICASRALDDLKATGLIPTDALLDGHYDFIRKEEIQVTTVVKGDNKSHVIAAASIVAKVFRDTYMASGEVAGKHAEYCFDRNKGYPSPVHKEALKTYGPTDLHRISWNIFDSASRFSPAQPLF